MSYTLEDESGQPYYVFHTDRVTCDDAGCPCTLPSSAMRLAQRRADSRDRWVVMADGVTSDVMSGMDARTLVDAVVANGGKPVLLRVVEDYTSAP
jgi:hypothetical protein